MKVGILQCHGRHGRDWYYKIVNPELLGHVYVGTRFNIHGLGQLRVIRVDDMGDDLGRFIICVSHKED